ncbi:Holliday junction resolvase RuvX [Candidatus Nanosynbacter lyticus]|uniref:Holliday junction resolvase RuvX n=1 Tax=Candidatus Nanosynbacter lyticus TaxID=2093824 RepID=UPI00255578BA|nr:Holliday junction resolvase RuvX [Candidatus Nanosynbacter lyticus]WLD46925.1 Holliday junction resolvase RuvX [Candidatus Nanosynbacter lyticus]
MKAKNFLALDVGEKRIGLAMADSQVRIAVPFGWVANDERAMKELAEIMLRHDISLVVVGYPRNQSGEPTQQTEFVVDFVRRLGQLDIDAEIAYQDESLTSVQAEQRLAGKIKDKGDIDAEAASIILQDYLEVHG